MNKFKKGLTIFGIMMLLLFVLPFMWLSASAAVVMPLADNFNGDSASSGAGTGAAVNGWTIANGKSYSFVNGSTSGYANDSTQNPSMYFISQGASKNLSPGTYINSSGDKYVIIDMRVKTLSSSDSGGVTTYVWASGTNATKYFYQIGKNSIKVSDNGVTSYYYMPGGQAYNALPPDTWYYTRVIVNFTGCTGAANGGSGSITAYAGTSLSNLELFAVSGQYSTNKCRNVTVAGLWNINSISYNGSATGGMDDVNVYGYGSGGAVLPSVSNAVFSGLCEPYQILTPSYIYNANDAGAETTSSYKWETASDAGFATAVSTVASGTVVASATSAASYTIQPGDVGRYIRFSVTPKGSGTAMYPFVANQEYIGATVSSTAYIVQNYTPLTVMSTSNTTNAAISGGFNITFNKALNVANAIIANIKFRQNGVDVPNYTIDVTGNKVTINYNQSLGYGQTYTIELSNLTDTLNQDIKLSQTISFTTVSATVSIDGFPMIQQRILSSSNIDVITSYQWLQGASSDGTYDPISGANGQSFLIGDNQKGKYLKLRVSYGNSYILDSSAFGPIVDNGNIAKTASINSYSRKSTGDPTKLLDGDTGPNSYWDALGTTTPTSPNWVIFDLGSSTCFNQFKLYERIYNGRLLNDYSIQYSDNPSGPWNDAISLTGQASAAPSTQLLTQKSFTQVRGRYVRLYITNSTNVIVCEFEVYNIPLTLQSTSPTSEVVVNGSFNITFSKPLSIASITSDTVKLKCSGVDVPFQLVWSNNNTVISLNYIDNLQYGTDYAVILNNIIDPDGMVLPISTTIQFKTQFKTLAITGCQMVGQTLAYWCNSTAHSVTYSWFSGDSMGGQFVQIQGANGNTLLLNDAAERKYIKLRVSLDNGETLESAPVGPVRANGNMALCVPVVTSSDTALFPISNINDGLNSTEWQASALPSTTTPVTVTLDFGAGATFNKVKIYETFKRLNDYKVQYSNDKTTWNDAVSLTGQQTISADLLSVIGFPTVTGRYVRLYITAAASNPYVFEFELYNEVANANTPSANNVKTINNTAGEPVYGTYDFACGSGGNDISTYRWLISSDINGTFNAIPGAVGKSYTPSSNDVGKYIEFEVTPKSSSTANIGLAITSAPVCIYAPSTISRPSGDGGGGRYTPVMNISIDLSQANKPAPVENVAQLNDIDGHWAKDDIAYLFGKNIIKGVGDNKFTPDAPVKRADLIVMIVRAFDIKKGDKEVRFNDVNENDYFATPVSLAASASIISGDNGLFRPNDFVTREELAKIAMAIYWSKFDTCRTDKADPLNFADNGSISQWAQTYVGQCVSKGLMKGVSGNMFAPKEAVTRAQAAVIIKRIMDLLK